jgi:hypothetical protein
VSEEQLRLDGTVEPQVVGFDQQNSLDPWRSRYTNPYGWSRNWRVLGLQGNGSFSNIHLHVDPQEWSRIVIFMVIMSWSITIICQTKRDLFFLSVCHIATCYRLSGWVDISLLQAATHCTILEDNLVNMPENMWIYYPTI